MFWGILIGLGIGIILMLIILLRMLFGTIKIDQHNSKKDIYRIEIEDLDSLAKKKYILLKVDRNADFSQE